MVGNAAFREAPLVQAARDHRSIRQVDDGAVVRRVEGVHNADSPWVALMPMPTSGIGRASAVHKDIAAQVDDKTHHAMALEHTCQIIGYVAFRHAAQIHDGLRVIDCERRRTILRSTHVNMVASHVRQGARERKRARHDADMEIPQNRLGDAMVRVNRYNEKNYLMKAYITENYDWEVIMRRLEKAIELVAGKLPAGQEIG